MVSELENIKKIEDDLIKVRLKITELEQEKEKVQKMANVANYGCGFFLFLTLCAFGYKTLVGVGLLIVTIFLFIFWALPKANKISKLMREIDQTKKKKKKKQLEEELKRLNYLTKVRISKEKNKESAI